MSTTNLNLWSAVEKTNPAHTKKVSIGSYSFTTIDAYSQIRKATEQFGAWGIDWGVKDEHFQVLKDDLILYTGKLWFNFEGKPGIVELHSCIQIAPETRNGRKIDDECIKKVATDALTKGLSKLGFNADVFLGRFDDNKYVESMKKQFAEEERRLEQEKHNQQTPPANQNNQPPQEQKETKETKEKPPLFPTDDEPPADETPADEKTQLQNNLKILLEKLLQSKALVPKIFYEYNTKIKAPDANLGLLRYYHKQLEMIGELFLLIAKNKVTEDERKSYYRQILSSKMADLNTLEKQFKERLAA